MMTKIKFWLLTAMLLGCVNRIAAQIYEARPIGNGKTDTAIVVFKYAAPEGDKYLRTPSNDFYLKEDTVLMRGTRLKMKDKGVVSYYDKSIFSMFTIFSPDKRPLASMQDSLGNVYYVDPIELAFSSENPEGTENLLAKFTEAKSRTYYEGAALIAIWVFIWLTWRISRRAEKIGLKKYRRGKLKPHNWLIGLLLFIAPVFSFFIIVAEIDMVTSMGEDCCWWLNGAYVSDFQRLFNMLLLFMAMRWQYKTIDAYGTGLEAFLCTKEYVPRKEIMYAILISVIACAVLGLIGFFCWSYLGATVGRIVLYIAGIGPLLFLAYSLIAQFVQMKRSAGWILSIVYMLFIILWAVGTIILIGVFVWQITKLIVPFIVLALFGKVIPGLGLDKPSAPTRMYYDDSGWSHSSAGARDSANRAIRESKQK